MRERRAVVLLCALLLRGKIGEIPQRKNKARDFTFGSFSFLLPVSRKKKRFRRGGDEDGEKRRRRRRRRAAAAEKAVVGVQRAHLLLTLGVFFPSRRRFGIRQLLDGIVRLARTTTTEEEEDERDDEHQQQLFRRCFYPRSWRDGGRKSDSFELRPRDEGTRDVREIDGTVSLRCVLREGWSRGGEGGDEDEESFNIVIIICQSNT